MYYYVVFNVLLYHPSHCDEILVSYCGHAQEGFCNFYFAITVFAIFNLYQGFLKWSTLVNCKGTRRNLLNGVGGHAICDYKFGKYWLRLFEFLWAFHKSNITWDFLLYAIRNHIIYIFKKFYKTHFSDKYFYRR